MDRTHLFLVPNTSPPNAHFCLEDSSPYHDPPPDRAHVDDDAALAFAHPGDCHATLLLQQGVHPKIVQERLGHSTTSMTLDTYSHVVPGMQKRAAADLEKPLLGEPKRKG